MAKYLLTVRSSGPLDELRQLPAPTDYLVECSSEAPGADGLERWSVDLQVAGAVADWASGPAYEALWTYLQRALSSVEPRPRATLTVKSRVDPNRVAVTFAYLGDHAVKRARDDLKPRIAGAIDAKSRRLKVDVDLTIHG
jgi:hypothetical protein